MRSYQDRSGLAGVIAAAMITLPIGLGAATNGFVVPLFHGSANSQAGYWEAFSVAVGAPGNLPDQPGATTSAVLRQSDANAFVTGSGNIYNLSTSAFVLADATPFPLGTVVLQTRTVGSELDYNSVSLTYSNDSGVHSLAPLFRYELNRSASQGESVSSLWQWDLTGLGVTRYLILFNAAGTSLSFDSMTLDTAGEFTRAFAEQPFRITSQPANLARWMYAFNGNPASRPTASAFAAFGSIPDFDTRDAQYLLGWNTVTTIPAGKGAKNYLIRHARLTLTLAAGHQYAYTGKLPDYRSYFPTNDPRYVPPAMSATPVELFGVGFRGGYTAATFQQETPFLADPTGGYYTNRSAYAAAFDYQGMLSDVSNNVGDDGTNEIAHPFPVAPFAVGQTTHVAEEQVMPVGSQLTFDLNLDDPLIYGYVQKGLDEGKLFLAVSCLLNASFSGPPNYPTFYTIFSPLASAEEFPRLEVEGEIVRPGFDGDGDGLPEDWENFHFGSLRHGATDDADGDGLNNLAEYQAGTLPTAAASVLRLLSIFRQPNATELHFTFAPGRQYSVQWSADLQQWQTLTSPSLTYSSAWLAQAGTNLPYPSPVYAVWRETNATTSLRFYRVGAE